MNTHVGIKKCCSNAHDGRVESIRSVHFGMLSVCKHISYLYSIRMECCIHRVVRGKFIPASSSSIHPTTHVIQEWRVRRRDRVRRRTSCICAVRAYVYACVYTCVYARTCVAFASVILNVREDISILVGKHANSDRTRSFACIVCTHARAAAYPYAIVRDLAGRPEKNAVAVPTDRRNVSPEAFARYKYDFPKRKENSTLLVHPIGASVDREASSGLNRLENVRIFLYFALIHLLAAFTLILTYACFTCTFYKT